MKASLQRASRPSKKVSTLNCQRAGWMLKPVSSRYHRTKSSLPTTNTWTSRSWRNILRVCKSFINVNSSTVGRKSLRARSRQSRTQSHSVRADTYDLSRFYFSISRCQTKLVYRSSKSCVSISKPPTMTLRFKARVYQSSRLLLCSWHHIQRRTLNDCWKRSAWNSATKSRYNSHNLKTC